MKTSTQTFNSSETHLNTLLMVAPSLLQLLHRPELHVGSRSSGSHNTLLSTATYSQGSALQRGFCQDHHHAFVSTKHSIIDYQALMMLSGDHEICTILPTNWKLLAKEGKPWAEDATQVAAQVTRPLSPGEDQRMKIMGVHKMVLLQTRLHCIQTPREHVGFEGIFKDPPVQPSCHRQGLPLDQVAQMATNASLGMPFLWCSCLGHIKEAQHPAGETPILPEGASPRKTKCTVISHTTNRKSGRT